MLEGHLTVVTDTAVFLIVSDQPLVGKLNIAFGRFMLEPVLCDIPGKPHVLCSAQFRLLIFRAL